MRCQVDATSFSYDTESPRSSIQHKSFPILHTAQDMLIKRTARKNAKDGGAQIVICSSLTRSYTLRTHDREKYVQ